MDKTKVNWADNYGTGQIYHSGVELALCSDDNHQVGSFVFCKDFFQDAVATYLNQESGQVCSIYGYRYDPKTMPACPQHNLKVLLANASDNDLSKKIPGVIDFVNQIEKVLGVSLTVVQECESPPPKYKNGVFLFVADKQWLLAPPLLSMWTLLARNGLQHTVGTGWTETLQKIIDGTVAPAQKNDKTYLQYAKPGIDLLLEKGFSALFGSDQKTNYPVVNAGIMMHHYSGAVSFGSCKAKKYFPNWGYPALETDPPGFCFT